MTRTDLDRAYTDVLFAHIDRLNDICEEDPYEEVVADLIAAFDEVARLDPRLNGSEPYRALRRGLGWLFPGDEVWAPALVASCPRIKMVVSLCFTGKDGDVQCVLSYRDDDKTLYRCVPLASLALSEDGPDLFASGQMPAAALQALALRLGCAVPQPAAAGASPRSTRRPRGKAKLSPTSTPTAPATSTP